ncbi:hypothetical protein GJV85_00375 [Sulfurimonas aquatica]|uniref:Uncharacterized protein n=1 Tax=Sulfurimonas aquatica TaxID=2672570 RepID=A0A975AY12_9BACT|nr:hypothetical protein [Sulfurimonas aquatica]QSZ40634.1 hypothetical protein GJV85_00375 [Sulfurimonas aquatica]
MKVIWYIFTLFFVASLLFSIVGFSTENFDFFVFQEQRFYFQFWISLSGILFTLIMTMCSYGVYKKTQLKPLKYIPLSFLLTALAYMVMAYHASYCEVCSDLALCAASHTYPNYLIIISFIIFVMSAIVFSRRLSIQKRAETLQRFSYGLIVATTLLILTLFISMQYMELTDITPYSGAQNLQAAIFILPMSIVLIAFIYFYRTYKVSKIYMFIAFLLAASFLPQAYHTYICADCDALECSEFYVVSGLIMFVVTGLLIHSVSLQIQDNKEV